MKPYILEDNRNVEFSQNDRFNYALPRNFNRVILSNEDDFDNK